MKNQFITVKKISLNSSSSLRTEKKEWQHPEIKQLNVQDTRSAGIEYPTEGQWLFFTWGPS